jgi:DNA-binding transcriptional LysR family regulator
VIVAGVTAGTAVAGPSQDAVYGAANSRRRTDWRNSHATQMLTLAGLMTKQSLRGCCEPGLFGGYVIRWVDRHRMSRNAAPAFRLSVTIPTVVSGLALGPIPTRVMEDRLARGEVRRLDVSPPFLGRQVSICYQISEFGLGLEQVVQLIRELVLHYRVFV